MKFKYHDTVAINPAKGNQFLEDKLKFYSRYTGLIIDYYLTAEEYIYTVGLSGINHNITVSCLEKELEIYRSRGK